MTHADYSDVTTEQFDEILRELVSNMSAAQILSYGDVYSFFAEELNNEVLREWEEKQKEDSEEAEASVLQTLLEDKQ